MFNLSFAIVLKNRRCTNKEMIDEILSSLGNEMVDMRESAPSILVHLNVKGEG